MMPNLTHQTISIIIPVYNEEKRIKGLLESILGQTARALIREIMVVNDRSTDRTVAVIRELTDRETANSPAGMESGRPKVPIRIIDRPEKTSRARARNVGASQATGDWLLFLDADMVLRSDYLERQRELFERYPDTLAAIGRIVPATLGHSPYFHYYFHSPDRGTNRYGRRIAVIRFTELLTQNLMMPADIFRSVGGFDETIHYGEDFVLAWCLQQTCPGRVFRYNPAAVAGDRGFTDMATGLRKFRHHFKPNLPMILARYPELSPYFPIASRSLKPILRLASIFPVNELFYFSPRLASLLFKARFLNALM
ncbi:MAG: glycosyltransferase family 2 protein [Candidatus Delongbacteria bacterium]|nr:glycosyltransferase family 2 protein [Candidatus Delongbacteria bacterium]